MIYYHTSVDASGGAAASKQVEIGRFHPNVNLNLNVNLDARGDLGFFAPSYTFETPVFGGQLAVSMMTVVGRLKTTLDGTLTASARAADGDAAGHDYRIPSKASATFIRMATLKWNSGVHNFMTYITGDIPVGDYEPDRLSNIGIGHGAIDGGVGYTYFDPSKGHEFSLVAGLTHNFRNPDTDYRNGLDWHLDCGGVAMALEAVLRRRRRLCLSAAHRR